MNERTGELNEDLIVKVIDCMEFSDIIQYPFLFVEVSVWDQKHSETTCEME